MFSLATSLLLLAIKSHISDYTNALAKYAEGILAFSAREVRDILAYEKLSVKHFILNLINNSYKQIL